MNSPQTLRGPGELRLEPPGVPSAELADCENGRSRDRRRVAGDAAAALPPAAMSQACGVGAPAAAASVRACSGGEDVGLCAMPGKMAPAALEGSPAPAAVAAVAAAAASRQLKRSLPLGGDCATAGRPEGACGGGWLDAMPASARKDGAREATVGFRMGELPPPPPPLPPPRPGAPLRRPGGEAEEASERMEHSRIIGREPLATRPRPPPAPGATAAGMPTAPLTASIPQRPTAPPAPARTAGEAGGAADNSERAAGAGDVSGGGDGGSAPLAAPPPPPAPSAAPRG